MLNQLFMKDMAEVVTHDARLILNDGRPVHVPESACVFIEQQTEAILGILYRNRLGQMKASEVEFLNETAKIIRQMTMSEYGNIHADVVAAAEQLKLHEDVLYFVMALYAKLVAAKRHTPPLIKREDDTRLSISVTNAEPIRVLFLLEMHVGVFVY